MQAFDEESPRRALAKLARGLTDLGLPCSEGDFVVALGDAPEQQANDGVGHYRDEDGMAHTLCDAHAEEFGEPLQVLEPFAGATSEQCPAPKAGGPEGA